MERLFMYLFHHHLCKSVFFVANVLVALHFLPILRVLTFQSILTNQFDRHIGANNLYYSVRVVSLTSNKPTRPFYSYVNISLVKFVTIAKMKKMFNLKIQ